MSLQPPFALFVLSASITKEVRRQPSAATRSHFSPHILVPRWQLNARLQRRLTVRLEPVGRHRVLQRHACTIWISYAPWTSNQAPVASELVFSMDRQDRRRVRALAAANAHVPRIKVLPRHERQQALFPCHGSVFARGWNHVGVSCEEDQGWRVRGGLLPAGCWRSADVHVDRVCVLWWKCWDLPE